MNCAEFYTTILKPASAFMAGIDARLSTPAADRFLLTAAGQESGWRNIAQEGNGPAMGPWQEEPIAPRLVLHNINTQNYMHILSRKRFVRIDPESIYNALLSDTVLSYGVARLLLWADPHPVPVTESDAWECYLRVWRPGKPWPESWASCWAAACAAIPIPEPAGSGATET